MADSNLNNLPVSNGQSDEEGPQPRKNARIWRYIRFCGNFGKNQDRKRKKESYLVRKIHSLWRLVIADRLRHFPVFPKESIRFFLGAFGYGLQRLAKGE